MELHLVALLRAAWIAGTLPILIASIPSSRLHSFHGLVLGFARRGKTMPSSSYVSFTFCLADGKLEENGTSLNCVFSFIVILFIANEEEIFYLWVSNLPFVFSTFSRQSNGALLNLWWLMCLYSITSIWNPRFCCYFEFVSLFSPLSNYLNGGYLWFRPSLFYDHQMVLLAWKGKYESSLLPWRFTTNNRCKFNDCSNPREWC